MEKALEILKDIVENSNEDKYDDMTEEELKAYVYEAIAELEEAMKPKSCDGCIREEEDMQDPHCAFCSRVCNDNYEAKEQL